MKTTAVLILTLLLAAPYAAADDSLVVALKETAAVEGPVVLLSHVAEITGNPDAVRFLSSVALGSAPEKGEKRSISVDDVKMRLDLAGADISKIAFEGAKAVTVTTGAGGESGVNEQMIASAAKSAVGRKIAAAGLITRCEVLAVATQNMLAPAGKIKIEKEPRLPADADLAASGSITVVVSVKEQDGYETAVPVTVKLTAYHKVTVAKVRVAKGDILTSASVSLEERPETETGIELDDAIGKRAAVSIPAGAVLIKEMVEELPVVKKGELVRVTVEREGVVVTFYGRSRDEGAKGDLVEVENPKTGKSMTARVTARGEVTVADVSERKAR